MAGDKTDYLENEINSGNYSLLQRILYGGMGHGVIIIPTHVFKILFTIIFPPFGIIIEEVWEFITNEFPYVTWEGIKAIFNAEVLNKIVYSFLLTSLFYIPGLLYTLSNLTAPNYNERGTIVCDPSGDICEFTKDLLDREEAAAKARENQT